MLCPYSSVGCPKFLPGGRRLPMSRTVRALTPPGVAPTMKPQETICRYSICKLPLG